MDFGLTRLKTAEFLGLGGSGMGREWGGALEELEEIVYYYIKIAGKKEAIRHINPLNESQKKGLKALQINIFE